MYIAYQQEYRLDIRQDLQIKESICCFRGDRVMYFFSLMALSPYRYKPSNLSLFVLRY